MDDFCIRYFTLFSVVTSQSHCVTSSQEVDVLDTDDDDDNTHQLGFTPLFLFSSENPLSHSSPAAGIHTPELTRAFPRYKMMYRNTRTGF